MINQFVKLGKELLRVVEVQEQQHRCGKWTTTLVLRNSTTDLVITAEGMSHEVVARLGGMITVKE